MALTNMRITVFGFSFRLRIIKKYHRERLSKKIELRKPFEAPGVQFG